MRIARVALFGLVALGATVILAVACGGGAEEEAAATPTRPAATGPASTSTTVPAASPSPEAPAATATTPAEPAAETLEISQVPTIKFDKTELRASAGAEVTVRFNNTDTGLPHNWALYRDENRTDPIVGANENICTAPCTGEVTFGPLDPGTYFFRCDVHPTQMTGELTVE